MKLSQITTQQIKLLSDEQLNSIVFGGEDADNVTDGGCADVVLLLGTRPDIAKERAEAYYPHGRSRVGDRRPNCQRGTVYGGYPLFSRRA